MDRKHVVLKKKAIKRYFAKSFFASHMPLFVLIVVAVYHAQYFELLLGIFIQKKSFFSIRFCLYFEKLLEDEYN